MSYNEKNDTQSAVSAGLVIAAPRLCAEGSIPYTVVPNDAKVHPLAYLLPNPTRIERSVTLYDPASFTTYVKRFREPGTTIFFDLEKQTFTAILDYHEGGTEGPVSEPEGTMLAEPSPRWCSHVAIFAARPTPEWKDWLTYNGRQRTQMEFATFIENHVEDLADEYGKTLLKIALNLQIKKDVTFVGQQRLEDGSMKLNYEESVNGTAGIGMMAIPSGFQLQIQPFYGGPTYRIECRFRFRLDGRTACFWYEMVRIDKLIETALTTMRENIEAQTGVTVLAGE
jgi:uncharacterized protein YfdQ (DUF2303 family)